MRAQYVTLLALVVALGLYTTTFAQAGPVETAGHIKLTYGLQGGLGLSGTLGAGGRFFLLGEQNQFAMGLGFSFLVSERNIFVPSLHQEAHVSGAILFTEIVGKAYFGPIQLQGSVGMAVVRREGRVKGLPVIMAMQGPYIGMDVRYALGPSWFGFIGSRVAFLETATLTVTGKREIVRVSTVPALVLGVAWEI